MLSIASRFQTRPSDVIGDLDTYTAFCFDEACCYLLNIIEDKDKKQKLYFDEDIENIKESSSNFLGGLFDALQQGEERNGK